MPLLELNEVFAGYGTKPILQGMTLSVEPGEIVTVIGPNGAGKSTILKTIIGLVDTTAGEILFDGESLVGGNPRGAIDRGISLVLQRASAFANLTVRENLELGARAVHKRRSGAFDIAAAVQRVVDVFPMLAERLDVKAGTLSGGQRRQVEVARALITEPRLLLLDEPTIGLAPKIVNEVFDHVSRVREQGTTIVVVEQNAMSSLAISNRGIAVDAGRVHIVASANEMRSDERVRRLYLGS